MQAGRPGVGSLSALSFLPPPGAEAVGCRLPSSPAPLPGPRAAGCLWKRQEALPPLGSCPGRLAPDRVPPPLLGPAVDQRAGPVSVGQAAPAFCLPGDTSRCSRPAPSWKEDCSCLPACLSHPRLSLPSICLRLATHWGLRMKLSPPHWPLSCLLVVSWGWDRGEGES